MYTQTETTPPQFNFDIFDQMTHEEAQALLSVNFPHLDKAEQNRIISNSNDLWLIRKSSEVGVLTVESRSYDWNKKDFIPKEPIRLRLTTGGWKFYEDTDYKPGDVLEITKGNMSADRIRDLQKALEIKYPPQNMIYPELAHDAYQKKMRELPVDHPHRCIMPCREVDKGILSRSDTTNIPSRHLEVARRAIQEKKDKLGSLPIMIGSPTTRLKESLHEQKNECRDPKVFEQAFHRVHQKLRENEWFKFARKSSIGGKESLSEILGHAAQNDNRSRAACVKLGWLKKDGTLADKVPSIIEESYRKGKADLAKAESAKAEYK
ncbi:hypothetical protein [Fluoribacter dumoffii]|uniref:Uncharacterized protein n=1 Tax=Fluoribacter dumoffii TaxID=463 RepID=A0A377G780_9GAMM|nr:hypothetical protein [Fluoribacter dumoffii]KTC89484.1 hypothetical protein Ldum_0552 [Fluoribacter dumoffii NY 23]STO20593.1 Uncharacterised protein [Fluoribacter dumoffii]